LRRIALPPHGRYAGEATYGPKALLVLHGSGTLTAASRSTNLSRGSIGLVPCGTQFVIEMETEMPGKTRTEELVVFQAGLPRHARGAT
jgi:mannose-6-phosphate isomerase-like protein (cupin superfamily)